jgi:ABC-type transporter Mla subunit MlaD
MSDVTVMNFADMEAGSAGLTDAAGRVEEARAEADRIVTQVIAALNEATATLSQIQPVLADLPGEVQVARNLIASAEWRSRSAEVFIASLDELTATITRVSAQFERIYAELNTAAEQVGGELEEVRAQFAVAADQAATGLNEAAQVMTQHTAAMRELSETGIVA